MKKKTSFLVLIVMLILFGLVIAVRVFLPLGSDTTTDLNHKQNGTVTVTDSTEKHTDSPIISSPPDTPPPTPAVPFEPRDESTVPELQFGDEEHVFELSDSQGIGGL